jgi:hypothetical protein
MTDEKANAFWKSVDSEMDKSGRLFATLPEKKTTSLHVCAGEVRAPHIWLRQSRHYSYTFCAGQPVQKYDSRSPIKVRVLSGEPRPKGSGSNQCVMRCPRSDGPTNEPLKARDLQEGKGGIAFCANLTQRLPIADRAQTTSTSLDLYYIFPVSNAPHPIYDGPCVPTRPYEESTVYSNARANGRSIVPDAGTPAKRRILECLSRHVFYPYI